MSDYVREIPWMDLGLRRLSKQANKEGGEGRGREEGGRGKRKEGRKSIP